MKTTGKAVRDRFNIQITDEEIAGLTFRKPAADSEELEIPQRAPRRSRRLPAGAQFGRALPRGAAAGGVQLTLLEGTGDREISTTMALIRMLTAPGQGQEHRQAIVPIVPDEARTFSMEGMFRQIGIYSSVGQLYTPQDAEQLMFYREDKQGQILEEGINEAGSLCSWLAAATAYSNRRHGVNMVPFLYLLLHVRIPASRRFHVGGRRQAGPGLPGGRYRRTHHACGRGSAASRRTPSAGHDRDSELQSPTIPPTPLNSR